MRALARVALFALASFTACGTPGPRSIPVTTSRYDALPEADRAEFTVARARLAAGEVHEARAAFQRLFEADPDNVMFGIWLQEADLRATRAEMGDEARAAADLSRRFAEEANARPTAANCVLAARLCADAAEAESWLARAERAAPDCAWVPYARAFVAARASDWPVARRELERARELDPGHLWSWWLDAWIATRTSSLDDAASLLEGFVERAEKDPRVEPRLLSEARLDLALVWTLRGDSRDARALLARVDPDDVDVARRLGALAAVEQALGELDEALAAVRAAAEAAPEDLLPAVQEALLCEEWLDDPVRAEEAWKRVLDKARNSPQVTSVLERTRATIRLERFAARRAGPPTDARPREGSEP